MTARKISELVEFGFTEEEATAHVTAEENFAASEELPYTPTTLKPYKRPDSYAGPTWYGYFPFLGQSRDSSALERSNFTRGLEIIGGESDTVLVVRDSHWAVGWIETIYIHESDEKALKAADEIAAALSDYPVVDEDHFCELEYTEACEYWARMSVRDRMEAIERSRCHCSIFAARRDELPQDDNGALLQYLTAA